MKKNVAIIIHKLYGGGAEHAACNLSLFLQEKCSVTLVAFDARNAAYPHTENTVDMGVPAAGNLFERLLLLPRRVAKLRKIKKERAIDVSVALLPGPSMASALSRQKGEKTIMSVRNYLSMQEGNKGLSALKTKFTASLSDCVVAVSRMAALDLHENFNIPEGKLRVIYNAVDPGLLAHEYDRSMPWLSGDGPVVITMGRLHEQKAHWRLIRAMAEVVKAVPNAKLVILGSGEYQQRLSALIKELGLEKNVFLPGYVVSPHGYVRRADLFVLSSYYEGMPNAMLEAMACGVPVVSTDCPSGPREILAPDTSINVVADGVERAKYGVLVPPLEKGGFNATEPLSASEKHLSKAILALLSDKELRADYARRAKSRAADFSPETIAGQWLSLIQSLANGNHSASSSEGK
ncbi:MAG: glycosyltransferase [Eubacteriales bacterium]|nr:glycosyltransferase [Eubacteriales bacterium]